MRFLLSNHIQNARQSLKSSRVRSHLTMLGVAVGVASITIILSLTEGANLVIKNQIDSLGGNLILVRQGNSSAAESVTDVFQPGTGYDLAQNVLTESDITKISSLEHVTSVAPLMILSGEIKTESKNIEKSPVIATLPKMAEVSNITLSKGQFLEDTINENTAVIGQKLSIDLFGTDSSLGRTFNFRNQTFTIIGILKQINEPISYNLVDLNNAAIINFSVGKRLNQNITQIQQIDIRIDSVENLTDVSKTIDSALTTKHNGQKDFTTLTSAQISQPTNELFYIISGVMAVAIAVSLIVGGISIMNIMLMTVSERTREIGIRKALGANNSDIMWQFLIESLILSIKGGIGGLIVGYALAYAASSLFLPFEPSINWQIAAISCAISVGVGLIFGIYPAAKASRKDPIESLKQYN